eukprot:scaffold11364_cov35-Prasinocladus_malaysianus.AAC.1
MTPAPAPDTATEQASADTRVCYRCGQKGHVAARCPAPTSHSHTSPKTPADTAARVSVSPQTTKRPKTKAKSRLPDGIFR